MASAAAIVAAVLAVAGWPAPLAAEGEEPSFAAERTAERTPAPPPGAILVEEILPALRGAPAGRVVLAPAPPLGGSRLVRRAEVVAALRRAGFPVRGLRIPARTRVRRRATTLRREALSEALRPAVARAAAPCELLALRVPARMSVPAGEPTLRVEGLSRPRPGSRRSSGTVRWRTDQGEARVPVTATLRCPPPAVRPGQRVRLRVRVGAVVASAPGLARQAGLVGDVVAVHNPASGRRLRGRVVAPGVVEVLP